jgi:hypothetical protein
VFLDFRAFPSVPEITDPSPVTFNKVSDHAVFCVVVEHESPA